MISSNKIMNGIDKVNRDLFTKFQNMKIRESLWSLNKYNFIYYVTEPAVLGNNVGYLGTLNVKERNELNFEACHQRTTQAFPCTVHPEASRKTNAEGWLDSATLRLAVPSFSCLSALDFCRLSATVTFISFLSFCTTMGLGPCQLLCT